MGCKQTEMSTLAMLHVYNGTLNSGPSTIQTLYNMYINVSVNSIDDITWGPNNYFPHSLNILWINYCRGVKEEERQERERLWEAGHLPRETHCTPDKEHAGEWWVE